MTYVVHLPYVATGSAPTGQAMPPNAAEFVALWLARLGDRAAIMVQDPRHTLAAQLHADWLPTRTPEQMEQSGHIGQGGSTANERLRAQGVILPSHYADVGNNVESYGRNHGGPLAALDALLASPAHREHLLGEGWYADQLLYGVGFCEAYYVYMASPPDSGI
jgi:hypothetical protein